MRGPAAFRQSFRALSVPRQITFHWSTCCPTAGLRSCFASLLFASHGFGPLIAGLCSLEERLRQLSQCVCLSGIPPPLATLFELRCLRIRS